MGDISGITLAISLISFVVLVVILVTLFYKPAKRLHVDCKFSDTKDQSKTSILDVTIENIGKRRIKLVAPYVKFSHAQHSLLFQVKHDLTRTRFPKMLKIGEKMTVDVDLSHYKHLLESNSFHPTHVKVIVKDMAGLDFASHNLEFSIV